MTKDVDLAWAMIYKGVMTALLSKHSSGCHMAAEKADDYRTPGREIWRWRCGQQATSTAGGRWRRQHRTELKIQKSCLWPMFRAANDNA